MRIELGCVWRFFVLLLAGLYGLRAGSLRLRANFARLHATLKRLHAGMDTLRATLLRLRAKSIIFTKRIGVRPLRYGSEGPASLGRRVTAILPRLLAEPARLLAVRHDLLAILALLLAVRHDLLAKTIIFIKEHTKKHRWNDSNSASFVPGSVLLLQGEAPNYHRR